MMNVICLVGRLVHDPEIKSTNSGSRVSTFAIAVDRYRPGQDGQRMVDYIDIVVWNKTAEFVCNYFKKGSWIAVNGRLETRSYEDKNGNKRKVFEVIADGVNFVGAKVDSNSERAQEPKFTEVEDDGDELPF